MKLYIKLQTKWNNERYWCYCRDKRERKRQSNSKEKNREKPNSLLYQLYLLKKSITNFMDSISRHHKLRKVGEAGKTVESVDRISCLPDSVLCHILSFLPTKYAVGTSILSTSWRYLFASIPNLDLDDSLLLRPQEANENPAREMSTFMNFVDRMFILRNISYVDRFRLKCGENIDASRVNAWICAALWRNIRELDLCISMKEFTMLPRNLFTCGTLVVLKLGAKFVLNVPIKDVDGIIYVLFNISAPALKSLTIDCLVVGSEYSTEFCEYEIVLNAPNLVYLKYIDFVPEGFSVKNLQSLVEAYIDVGFSSQQVEDGILNYNDPILEILRGISEVQLLHLSNDFMEAVDSSPYILALPTFYKLTRLELGAHEYVEWRKLPYWLEISHRLETLIFYEGLLPIGYEDDCRRWYPPRYIPYCFLYHLKTIEIWTFRGHNDELSIIRYFLKNASGLEKMKIHTDRMTQTKVSKKLLKFPRCSKACQVAFS